MIDINTFLLVLAIGNISFALLIAGYARSGPVNPAMQLWQWAKLVQGCAYMMGWVRPDWFGSWLAVVVNSCLILGVLLEAAAYCTFFGFQRWRRVLYPAAAAGLLLYVGARFIGAPPEVQSVLISFIIAVLTGAMSFVLLWTSKSGSVLQRIIGINNLVFFIAMSMRVYTGLAPGGQLIFTPGAVQAFTFIAGYVLLIVNGFGFLLLCKEKDDSQMEQLATIDSLTGLVNRRAFFERTDIARMLASRQRHPISLMMVDIDHFKRLNDHYGHAAGDEALRVFAATALQALRDPDIMGRLGGEEFAVALPGTDLGGALQAAERLRLAVRGARLLGSDADYEMTVSIGVVTFDPDEHINAALARADHALYEAKRAGRDRVEIGLPLRQCA